jgi:hypothetical protein
MEEEMKAMRIKRLVALGVTVAGAAVLLAAYHHVRAQEGDSHPVTPLQVTGAPLSPSTLTSGSHVLLTTLINWGNDNNVPVGSGYQPVDLPTTVNCPSTSGCTIAVEAQLQLGGNGKTLNAWAICAQVDGNYIHTPGCPFQGYLPVSMSVWTVGSWSQQTSVSAGDHTVETSVYTDYGAFKDTYNIVYRVYAP